MFTSQLLQLRSPRLLILILEGRRVLGVISVGNCTRGFSMLLDAASVARREISVMNVSKGCVYVSNASRWSISRQVSPFSIDRCGVM